MKLFLPPETLLASSRQQLFALCQNDWNLMQDSRKMEKTMNGTSANRRQTTIRTCERALREPVATAKFILGESEKNENSKFKKI
jgi:hypothetical protein